MTLNIYIYIYCLQNDGNYKLLIFNAFVEGGPFRINKYISCMYGSIGDNDYIKSMITYLHVL